MPVNSKHPFYPAWQGMKRRCYNPNTSQYDRYGGRGISICKRWLLPCGQGFQNFADDMGDRPFKYTLERIDNDGNYTPENCKWASRQEQQRNQSVTRMVIIEGITYKAVELSDISGLKTDTIVIRAKQDLSYADVISPETRVFKAGLALGGTANGARQKSKTHCPKGHEYNKANTYITKQGWRRCKVCRRKVK